MPLRVLNLIRYKYLDVSCKPICSYNGPFLGFVSGEKFCNHLKSFANVQHNKIRLNLCNNMIIIIIHELFYPAAHGSQAKEILDVTFLRINLKNWLKNFMRLILKIFHLGLILNIKSNIFDRFS